MPRNPDAKEIIRHGPKLKAQVGAWLRNRGKTRGPDRTVLAEFLGVSPRTLWNWAHREPKKLGRPRTSPSVRFRALWRTRHEWEKQGRSAGWRPLRQALGQGLSLRLLQSSLSLCKARHRAKTDRRRKSHRLGLEVLAVGAVARQDSTQLVSQTWAEVIQDAASREILVAQVGGPITAEADIRILETLKAQGRLPLVLQRDNGSAYTSQSEKEYLDREQVVALQSRVHTPTDNAGAERVNGEIKAEVDLACRGPVRSPQQVQVPLAQAVHRLNTQRLKRCLGYMTPADAGREKPGWYTRVNRAEFFEAAQASLREARSKGGTARQVRSAERQAVIDTLVRYGLAVQTRGGCPVATAKPEELS